MMNFLAGDSHRHQTLFRDIDMALARLLRRLAPEEPPEVFLAALLTSRAHGEGHVCLDLRQWENQIVRVSAEDAAALTCPDSATWAALLRKSELVDEGEGEHPLVLDGKGRVYLQRLYRDEQQLAGLLRHRALSEHPPPPMPRPDELRLLLGRYFGSCDHAAGPGGAADWQKVAAAVAALKKLCIISGAPGTGKTTTVAKILGVLLEMSLPQPLRIHLCAPTGKAAARLGEALAEASRRLDCPSAVASVLASLEPCTIHRLLGVQPGGGFRHHEKNRLPTDLVVVDEASMVDLVLMSRLIRAVPEDARLVILGDKDQLASVEAGAVFGDLCRDAAESGYSPPMRHALAEMADIRRLTPAAAPPSSTLGDCLVVLRTNYRFAPEAGIGAVAQAVNAGHAEALMRVLQSGREESVSWRPWHTRRAFDKVLAASAYRGYETYLASRGPEEALAHFGRYRILSVLRSGPYGVERLNAVVMEMLQQKRLIAGSRPWFIGRPVMMTRNHYPLGLYNGDTGLTWPDAEGRLKVWFAREDGRLRAISPQQLPEHETVFAMTVHKSQGSEFDHTLLVLPDRDTPLLTRELLYTGCTRARRRLTLMAPEEMIGLALSRTIQRTSGLTDALRQ